MNSITFNPIGQVKSATKYRYEAPRQSVFANNNGIIRMNPGCDFETALRDLDGFTHIWVIFCFHLNQDSGWKTTVNPPVAPPGVKIGLFATRSPYRTNPIGMSVVQLVEIKGLELHIRNFDMLDGTPVLDIKPYIVHADSFPEASTGWLPNTPELYEVSFDEQTLSKIEWLRNQSGLDLESFAKVQLSIDPLNHARKRVEAISPEQYVIGCRTWKLSFKISEEQRQIEVVDLISNYLPEELIPTAPDRYQDKEIHRQFILEFARA
ncbi:MAG: tRNA (N6-threonylcarbamoyladenosine(37)-N6)-methyltransferase TrmO [Victivallaceae bacterium]|nr:tRNA (N6-threonylcarbamoyladenosine(37)-N6)-methyltransferase TrmO [Victivallaceae bacterium]